MGVRVAYEIFVQGPVWRAHGATALEGTTCQRSSEFRDKYQGYLDDECSIVLLRVNPKP